MSKTNFDLFIEKSLKIVEYRKKPFELEVEEFGLISFIYPNTNSLLNYIDAAGRAVSVSATGEAEMKDIGALIDASKELVFNCCPYLQSVELHEKLEIKDPLESAILIFGVDTTMSLASEIADRAKGNKTYSEISQKVKN